MIAGGLDTTPACILLGVAILSGPQGQYLQQKLLEEINKVYPDGSAWKKCLDEEKVEYLTAFCKEVLRFWTVIPMSLPRVNVKEVVYKGARIPAGTTFLMVSALINFFCPSIIRHNCTSANILCFKTPRTPGQLILTMSTLNRPSSSARSASSTSRKDLELSILPLELGLVCAQVHTSQIARCTLPSCASLSRWKCCQHRILLRGLF
jgi:hypothetical protein